MSRWNLSWILGITTVSVIGLSLSYSAPTGGASLQKKHENLRLLVDVLEEVQQKYGDTKTDKRRTRIESDTGEPEYTADDFIVEEDNVVIVSRDGWIKRQKEVKDLSTTRLREGDAVLTAFAGSTRATCAFFTNFGVATRHG